MINAPVFWACVREYADSIRWVWEDAGFCGDEPGMVLTDEGEGGARVALMPRDDVLEWARRMGCPESSIEEVRTDPGDEAPILIGLAVRGTFMLGRIAVPSPPGSN